mmetsp:Transcript_30063/g.75874  ORF Transcript_30063/g.75874 Transcript_30063/m.75874 type:complete len:279 (+) Transcript_30063:411-1247(+)
MQRMLSSLNFVQPHSLASRAVCRHRHQIVYKCQTAWRPRGSAQGPGKLSPSSQNPGGRRGWSSHRPHCCLSSARSNTSTSNSIRLVVSRAKVSLQRHALSSLRAMESVPCIHSSTAAGGQWTCTRSSSSSSSKCSRYSSRHSGSSSACEGFHSIITSSVCSSNRCSGSTRLRNRSTLAANSCLRPLPGQQCARARLRPLLGEVAVAAVAAHRSGRSRFTRCQLLTSRVSVSRAYSSTRVCARNAAIASTAMLHIRAPKFAECNHHGRPGIASGDAPQR